MRLFRAICWICALLGMLHGNVPALAQSSEPNAQPPAGTAPLGDNLEIMEDCYLCPGLK